MSASLPHPPARRFVEALSWRLATELLRRHAGELRLVEAHGGGGQYDELRVYPRNGHGPFVVSLNRPGSAHFSRGGPWTGIWADALAAEDPKLIVDELERRAGLVSGAHLPAATPDVLTFRVISVLLSTAAFERGRWEVRSGYADTSDGSSVRSDLFEPFPSCRGRLSERDPGDLLGEPAYRFWFLVRNGQARLAFEDTGVAWDRQGHEMALFSQYREAGTLGPLVGRLWGSVFG